MGEPNVSKLYRDDTTETVFITQIISNKNKTVLASVKEKVVLSIGDEIKINNETLIVQNSPSIHEGPSFPDKAQYEDADVSIKNKHKGKRLRTVTYTYRVSTPALSRKMDKLDLTNKQILEIVTKPDKSFKINILQGRH